MLAPTMRISATAYTKFRMCPRLYFYEVVLRLVLVRDDGPRFFGKLYHHGMEAWWWAKLNRSPWQKPDVPLVSALKAIAANAKHVYTDPFEVARAEVMMIGYHARYFELETRMPYERPPGAEAGVEIAFSVELRDAENVVVPGWMLVGRKDALAFFPREGRAKVVEHKHTSADITTGSDYWARLAIDTQSSIYVEAAQRVGFDIDTVLYDVSKKPDIRRKLATPEEKRKYTKGKGCKICGGRAGGKLGVAKGTGIVMIEVTNAGKLEERAAPCPDCKGSGWNEHPALHATQRIVDENVEEFRERLRAELETDPQSHYRMADLRRDAYALAEARADLAVTTGEIGALLTLARNATTSGDMRAPAARQCFPRNTQTCTDVYGRRCDYLSICAGETDGFSSPLYQIRERRTEQPT